MQKTASSGFNLYGFTLLVEVFILSIMYLLNQVIDVTASAFVLFFSPVIITAWYGGLKSAILATALTSLAITYFFLPPINSLFIGGEEFIQACVFLIQSFLFITPVTILQNKIALKKQVEIAQNQQEWFEDVLQLMPIPMLLIEPATAQIVFSNKAAEELAGDKFLKSLSIKEKFYI